MCVNGMSRHARAGSNANSALLVGVDPADLPGDDVLAGVALQRQIEHAAFAAGRACGAADYTAPAQTVGDFLSGRSGGASTLVTPTYPRGVAWTDLHECLPAFVTRGHGGPSSARPQAARFRAPEAVLTGVEARSSSPVRIVRDEAFQACMATAGEAVLDAAAKKEAPRVEGLYPCGEGAGYAGGHHERRGRRVARGRIHSGRFSRVASCLRGRRSLMGEFSEGVFEQVRRIPRGKCATYGQIARLMGRPARRATSATPLRSNPAPGADAATYPVIASSLKTAVCAGLRVPAGLRFSGPCLPRRAWLFSRTVGSISLCAHGTRRKTTPCLARRPVSTGKRLGDREEQAPGRRPREHRASVGARQQPRPFPLSVEPCASVCSLRVASSCGAFASFPSRPSVFPSRPARYPKLYVKPCLHDLLRYHLFCDNCISSCDSMARGETSRRARCGGDVSQSVKERVLLGCRHDQAIDRAACALKRGGEAVIFPTDTVYGVGVAVRYVDAPARLFELKRRDEESPSRGWSAPLDDLSRYGRNVAPYAVSLRAGVLAGRAHVGRRGVEGGSPKPTARREGAIGLRMPAARRRSGWRARRRRLWPPHPLISGSPAPKSHEDLDPAFSLAGRLRSRRRDGGKRRGLDGSRLQREQPRHHPRRLHWEADIRHAVLSTCGRTRVGGATVWRL